MIRASLDEKNQARCKKGSMFFLRFFSVFLLIKRHPEKLGGIISRWHSVYNVKRNTFSIIKFNLVYLSCYNCCFFFIAIPLALISLTVKYGYSDWVKVTTDQVKKKTT